jgi:hypothetical protein
LVVLVPLPAWWRHRLRQHDFHEHMCKRPERRPDVQADSLESSILVAQECLDVGTLAWGEDDLAAAGGTAVSWVVVEFLGDRVVVDPDFDDDGRWGMECIRSYGS